MTYDDINDSMKYNYAAEQRHKKDLSDFDALCADLEHTLNFQAPEYELLNRQAIILDHLLTAMMQNQLGKDKRKGDFTPERIELILRVQKQCADTIKTNAAIDYMNTMVHRCNAKGLSAFGAEHTLPPPPES